MAATLIKQQILKQLSKYTKNLSVDQISLEVLKGRGHLNSLELNEEVLNEVLGLPSWLSVRKAVCIRVAIKVPWTRLKSSPLQIMIEEIQVDLVISSTLRQPNGVSVNLSSENATGLAAKVVEGMSIYVNSLEAYFHSEVFDGSIMLSRLSLESRTPTWQLPKDLHMTRLSDRTSGQVLIFKQLDWQTLRVEVTVRPPELLPSQTTNPPSSPLKLLTGNGKARITLKKTIADGQLLRSRVQLILSDILWVAGIHQLHNSVRLSKYFTQLYEASKEQLTHQVSQKIVSSGNDNKTQTNHLQFESSSDYHKRINVIETSYHLYVSRLDVQLCEDNTINATHNRDYPEPWMAEASLRVTFDHLVIDMYPHHLANADRSSWVHYIYTNGKGPTWSKLLLDFYKQQMQNKLGHLVAEEILLDSWARLACRVLVVRLGDIRISSLSCPPEKQTVPLLLCSDRSVMKSPVDIPFIHWEFTDYYYLPQSKVQLPCPPRCCFIDVGPSRVFFEARTLRWLHYIYENICTINKDGDQAQSIATQRVDFRMEFQMPRVVVSLNEEGALNAPQFPTELNLCAAIVTITNSFVEAGRDLSALKTFLSHLVEKRLFTEYFDMGEEHIDPLPIQTNSVRQYFSWLVQTYNTSSNTRPQRRTYPDFFSDPVWLEAVKELSEIFSQPNSPSIFSLVSTSCWAEFRGHSLFYPKPLPFLSDFFFTAYWIQEKQNQQEEKADNNDMGEKQDPKIRNADNYLLATIDPVLKVVMDEFQYLFVLKVLDGIARLFNELVSDQRCSNASDATKRTACMTLFVPVVNVSLLLSGKTPQQNEPSDLVASENSQISDEFATGCLMTNPFTSVEENLALGQTGEMIESFPEFLLKSDECSSVMDDSVSVATDLSDDSNSVIAESDGTEWLYGDIFQFADIAVEAENEVVEQRNRQKRADSCRRLASRQIDIITGSLASSEFILCVNDRAITGRMISPSIEVTEKVESTLGDFHILFDSKTKSTPNRANDRNLPILIFDLKSTNSEKIDFDRLWKAEATVTGMGMELSSLSISRLIEFFQAGEKQSTNIELKASLREVLIDIKNTTGPPLCLRLRETYLHRIGGSNIKESFSQMASTSHDQNLKHSQSESREDQLDQLRKENLSLRNKLMEAKALIEQLAQNNFHLTLE